jgi:hypothetical protein
VEVSLPIARLQQPLSIGRWSPKHGRRGQHFPKRMYVWNLDFTCPSRLSRYRHVSSTCSRRRRRDASTHLRGDLLQRFSFNNPLTQITRVQERYPPNIHLALKSHLYNPERFSLSFTQFPWRSGNIYSSSLWILQSSIHISSWAVSLPLLCFLNTFPKSDQDYTISLFPLDQRATPSLAVYLTCPLNGRGLNTIGGSKSTVCYLCVINGLPWVTTSHPSSS